MKFDIEIIKSETLTSSGYEKISDIFYRTGDALDKLACFNKNFLGYNSTIDTSIFPLYSNLISLDSISASNFVSSVGSSSDFKLHKYLIKSGTIIPFFYSGTGYFYRYPITLSNNYVKRQCAYSYTFDRYECIIPEDILDFSLNIITSTVNQTGNLDIKKQFEYAQISDITVITEDINSLQEFYNLNTIIIATSTDIDSNIFMEGIYHTTYKTKPSLLIDKNRITKNNNISPTTLPAFDVYVDYENLKIFYMKNGIIHNLIHELAFKIRKNNYKYLIENDIYNNNVKTVYLSIPQITNTNEYLNQTIPANSFGIYPLDEFPANNIIISTTDSNLTSSKIKNSFKITNNTSSDIQTDISISYDVFPSIAYTKNVWDANNDIRHLKVDIAPNKTKFTDGTICLMCNEIDANMIPAKIELTCLGDKYIHPFFSKQIIATVYNINNDPLSNQNVTITFTSTYDHLSWTLSDSNSISGITSLAGEFKASLLNNNKNVGYYIQKEWVGDVTDISNPNAASTQISCTMDPNTKNKIYLPYALDTTDIDKFYLFMVTADDPVLGQLKERDASITDSVFQFSIQQPFEFYKEKGNYETYEVTGRKIAYVHLTAGPVSGNLDVLDVVSRFIKPVSITIQTNPRNFFIRNAIIYENSFGNDDSLGIDLPDSKLFYDRIGYSKNLQISEYSNPKWLKKWLYRLDSSYYKRLYNQVSIPEYTEIVFDKNLPGIDDENVLGYYFRIDDSAAKINIVAECNNLEFDIKLVSDTLELETKGVMMNEDSFRFSSQIGSEFNTYIGPYSYLTLTEYVNSTYGSNFTKYICKYSKRVLGGQTTGSTVVNRCSKSTNQYYDYEGSPDVTKNMFCVHTPEYDSLLNTSDPAINKRPCPYLDVQLINPFILLPQ